MDACWCSTCSKERVVVIPSIWFLFLSDDSLYEAASYLLKTQSGDLRYAYRVAYRCSRSCSFAVAMPTCGRQAGRVAGSGRLAFDVLPSQKNDVLMFFSRFSRVGCHVNCPQLYHLLRETDFGRLVFFWKTTTCFQSSIDSSFLPTMTMAFLQKITTDHVFILHSCDFQAERWWSLHCGTGFSSTSVQVVGGFHSGECGKDQQELDQKFWCNCMQ